MKLLGVVTEVTERGMQISLPNGLKGTVTRAEASEPFAGKDASRRARRGVDRRGDDDDETASDDDVASDASSSESESDSDSDDAGDPLSLTEAFEIGQVVRCVVRRLDKGKSGGKRIDLATRLDAVCAGRAADALREGVNVPATVESVEDHGFVLSFGGGANGPRGFLPRKSAGKRALVRGSVLDVVLTGEKKGDDAGKSREDGSAPGTRVLHATADPKRVASAVTHESDGTAMSTLLPGMLVNARVRSVLSDGVSVNFMTYFVATVDAFHVGDAKGSGAVPDAAAPDPNAAHKAGERCRARVLYVDAASKRVGLTLRPRLLRLGLADGADDDAVNSAVKPGTIYEDAIVRRVDPAVGVLLELPADGSNSASGSSSRARMGYCHISDAADDRVDKLERRFRVGKTVRARVVGHRALDGVAVVSCRPSTLDQPFLSLDELAPGMDVRGEVVAVEPYGAVVKLAPGVKALCPPNHVSDVPGRVTSSKVREGAKLKFRVLSVDLQRRRAAVTHKKALVKSELAVVASLADAVPGATSHGVVTGVEPYGVFVQLWGNVRGLAGLQDLGLAADQTPAEAFAPGQVVRATVVRADAGEGKVKLSLVGDAAGFSRDDFGRGEGAVGEGECFGGDVGAPAPGTIVESAVVKRVDESTGNVRVTLPGGVPGVIPPAQMSDHPASGAALAAALRKGDVVGPLVALEAKPRRSVLSRKATLVDAARAGKLPADVSGVVVGGVYPGYVASATANAGVFVRFLGRLTGLAPPSQLTDRPVAGGVDPEEAFELGQTVLARVVSVDATVEPPRMSLSLAPRAARLARGGAASASATSDAALVRAIFADVDAADALHDARAGDGDGDEANGDGAYLSAETAAKLAPGAMVSATVHASRDYGVLVDMPDVDPDAVGLVAFHQLPGGPADGPEDAPEEGTVLRGVVLDVSRREGVVDVAARPGLLAEEPKKKTKTKKKSSSAASASALAVGAEVDAIVELVKPEYAVVTLPEYGDAVGYASTRALNRRFPDDDDAPFIVDGTNRVALVVAANEASGSPGGRLILARKDAGADGGVGGAGGASAAAASAGERLEGVIREAQAAQAIVDLPGGRRGRLHVTELPGGDGDFPMRNVRAGDAVTVASMGPAGDRGTMLELTARRSPAEAKKAVAAATDAGAGDGGGAGVAGTAALATAKPGDAVAGVVSAVSADTLAIAVAPGLTVRIPRVDTADDAATLRVPLATRFAAGRRVENLTVTSSDVARRKMTVTLRSEESRDVVVGAKMAGLVTKIAPGGGGVHVQLTSRRRGRVHVTDMSDEFKPEPWRRFKIGDAVDARVVGVGEGGEVDLSVRASALADANDSAKKKRKKKGGGDDASFVDDAVASVAQLAPGARVSGYVKQVNKGGCFVALSRSVDARVKMCNLGDAFVADPAAAFPKGALVSGVVVSVDAAAGRCELTLRSDGQDGGAKSNAANDAPVEVGAVQMGTVRRVQTYGVFVTLDGSGRSGLCHISAFADARIKDGLEAHVRAGERVRVKVLDVDRETGRVSLGMKPSLFEDADGDADRDKDAPAEEDPLMADEDEEDEEEDEEEEDEDDEDEEEDSEPEEEEEGDDDDLVGEDDDDEEEESDDDEDALIGDDDSDDEDDDEDDAAMDHDASDDDASDEDDDDDSNSDSDDSDSEPAAMDADVGFDWDAETKAPASTEDDAARADDGKPKSKREKARLKAQKELELHRKEQALRERADAAPENAQEFEKLLMANPRSSYVWIRYLAFQVSVGAHDEAREVAERALKAVPASEEDERMNLWVAYLNLENLHGKPTPREALLKLFDRATKVANPKKLHLTLAGIYERSGDEAAATQTLKTAARRFSQSAKVWLALIRAAIVMSGANPDPEGVKRALDRATQALPRRKHVKVLVQTALLEIREGSVERGRTMFESILRNYPRRTDIWSTYIDQEIKQGDPERTRALLERATHLELNPKSMKFLFKRYLDFERSVGDKKRIEHVKTRAMEYVQSKFG